MTSVTVSHTFVSNIADDPKASAAGEVLPSHWNANHTVSLSGFRTILAANTNYYVSTTGSDSKGGTNSTTDAWATLQHALFFIANNLDIGGFTITINVGSGSFAGAGVATTVGGGTILIKGAGSASTTLTDGPNDGVYNDASILSMFFNCESIIGLNNVTLQSPTAANFLLELEQLSTVVLGDPTLLTNTGDIVFDSSAAGGNGQVGINISNNSSVVSSGGSYSIKGTNWNSLSVYGRGFGFVTLQFGQFTPRGTWTISNSPTMTFLAAQENSFVNLGLLTLNGAFTGFVATGNSNSYVREAIGIGGVSASNGILFDASSVTNAGSQLGDGGLVGLPGPLPAINTQTSTGYTLVLTDSFVIVEMNNAGANTVTVPSSSTVLFDVGTKIWVTQIGAGATTVTAASTAVTINNAGAVGAQWSSVKLYKRGADEWTQTNA